MVSANPIPTGDATKPEIVIAVAEECLEAGASEVTIGEAGQVDRFAWDELPTLDGSTNLDAEVQRLNDCYTAQVTHVCLNAESPEWDAIASPYSGLDEIYVPSLVARADRVISVPVIKTHRWTQMTCSLKNLFGITPLDYYDGYGMGMRSRLHEAPGGLERSILDIVAGLKPDLTIVDGSICCEGNGPHVMPGWWGETVDMRDRLGDWLVLASTDLVSADATAARIIGYDPSEVHHIKMAYEQGLGQMREDRVDIVGAELSDLSVEFERADQTKGFWEVIIPGLMMTLAG
jgi:uncharacterized protein (DUF362 family)